MKQFGAAIFDMDGLLLDSERLALKAFRAVCTRLDLGDHTDLFMRCIGANHTMGESILRKGLVGIADFDTFNTAWNVEYRRLTDEQPIPLKPGVLELLTLLVSMEMPLAVATSTKTDRATEKLEASAIARYFNVIVGGDQVAASKPDPAIYLRAAQELSARPTRCLALEDSTNGVRAAVSAGMTVIQIPDLVEPSEELMVLGHIVLGSLTEVPEYDFSR